MPVQPAVAAGGVAVRDPAESGSPRTAPLLAREMGAAATDPGDVLKQIRDSKQRQLFVLRDLTPWLRDPNAVKLGTKMPNYQLSEHEIDALVAYLQSL